MKVVDDLRTKIYIVEQGDGICIPWQEVQLLKLLCKEQAKACGKA